MDQLNRYASNERYDRKYEIRNILSSPEKVW